VPNLAGVAAVAPPIDLEGCSALLAQPRNRVYERYFVRCLVGQVLRQQRHSRHLPRTRFPARLTLQQFDDLYTAPRWGYFDALDYYRRASAAPLLAQVTVPAFVLTSRDDPFIAVEPFERLPLRPQFQVHIAERGGHLGFLGWDGVGGIRWGERCVLEWVTHSGRAGELR
jgi:predicted alpha/beta-fold hydrolase